MGLARPGPQHDCHTSYAGSPPLSYYHSPMFVTVLLRSDTLRRLSAQHMRDRAAHGTWLPAPRGSGLIESNGRSLGSHV